MSQAIKESAIDHQHIAEEPPISDLLEATKQVIFRDTKLLESEVGLDQRLTKHPKYQAVSILSAFCLRRDTDDTEGGMKSEPDSVFLDPNLFPRLRICSADFSYLHCSISQWLSTLETCCSFEYDLA